MSAYPPAEAVKAALEALGAVQPNEWSPIIARACREEEINTPLRVAHFLGTICHETAGLRHTVENLNYSVDGLLSVFGRHRISAADARRLGRKPGEGPLSEARQAAIANLIYGGAWGRLNLGNTQPADGWYFRGKGLIQLTGRANHTRFAKAIGTDVVKLQTMLETREGAAMSAAAFWQKTGCNAPADIGSCMGVRTLVNGGTIGLGEVEELTDQALKALLQFGEAATG